MGRWTRRRLLILAAVAVVGAAVGGYVVFGVDRYDEEVAGPAGDYPPAVGDSPPADPSTVVSRAGSPVILDGLRIERGDGITAYDLRSGAEFWAYRRDGREARRVAAAGGAVYVRWDDGLLVRFDPRAAEARWHADTGGDEYAELVTVGTTVAVLTDSGVTAYHAEDGDEAWSAPLRQGCTTRGEALAAGDVLVLGLLCREGGFGAQLLGPDGTDRWIGVEKGTRVIPAGEDRFAVAVLLGDATVYSAQTGEVVSIASSSVDQGTYRSGNGEVLVSANPDATEDGELAYAGWSTTDERLAWRVPTDGTWWPTGSPVVVDELVYAVRRDADRDTHRTLVVYDAATGTERARTEVDLSEYVPDPELPYTELEMRISYIAAGTVTLVITEPSLGSGVTCEQCGIVLAEPESA
ncbi:PQQ-binding-like beta-propeller repeat protein [Actinophytocola sp.]|uniref:outer membrane protein assembly factor BamB family protein n=1 Tax=Actinophytocola sp. TaxID=1872138 RepID=UPI003D6A58CF